MTHRTGPKRRLSAIIGALAVVVLCSASCTPSTFTAADDAAIRSVLSTQGDAWNQGDLEGFMEGYLRSDSLVFTSGGNVRRGWDETLTKYRKSYSDKGLMGTLAFSELEVHPVGPDAAWLLGRWTLTDTAKAATGLFTLVVVRTETGDWRVAHDHTSVDAR